MFYYIHPEKTIFCRKSAPYRVADPIGGILTFLRKIFAPYRVGGLYNNLQANEAYLENRKEILNKPFGTD